MTVVIDELILSSLLIEHIKFNKSIAAKGKAHVSDTDFNINVRVFDKCEYMLWLKSCQYFIFNVILRTVVNEVDFDQGFGITAATLTHP